MPPDERPVNLMFQSYALFPHMTVSQNIGYGLKKEGVPAARIRERVAEMLALVKLEPLATRKPDKLSGGAGPDVVIAGCQSALCYAGTYNALYGNDGHDRLGARNDTGTDILNGGDGYDVCIGNRYDSYIGCEDVQKG